MIIVEGPDGAGKTTLIDRLQHDLSLPRLPRACTTLGGPLDNLAQWVDNVLGQWPVSGIYDRFPMMSDYVYGPITRGHLSPMFASLSWSVPVLHRMNQHDPLIIFCMPSLGAVQYNVHHTKDDQMRGVAENVENIYSAYQSMISMFSVYFDHVVVYDYERWSVNAEYQDWFHDQIETYRNRYPERFVTHGSTQS